jgi:hypothetical protein
MTRPSAAQLRFPADGALSLGRRVLQASWPFVMGAFVTWLGKVWLLSWVAEPLVRNWGGGPCGRSTWVSTSSSSVFPSFAYITGAGAVLAALPLLARQVSLPWFPAPSRPRPGLFFVLLGYSMTAVGLYVAQRFLWPAVVRDMLRDQSWCGETWVSDPGSILNAYVARACAAAIGVVVCLESALVAFAWWLSRRVGDPSR